MVERTTVNRLVVGSSPTRGATFDKRHKKPFCQRILSSHVGLFHHLSLSSGVSFSKVTVFR